MIKREVDKWGGRKKDAGAFMASNGKFLGTRDKSRQTSDVVITQIKSLEQVVLRHPAKKATWR
jgi:hypothetical protein